MPCPCVVATIKKSSNRQNVQTIWRSFWSQSLLCNKRSSRCRIWVWGISSWRKGTRNCWVRSKMTLPKWHSESGKTAKTCLIFYVKRMLSWRNRIKSWCKISIKRERRRKGRGKMRKERGLKWTKPMIKFKRCNSKCSACNFKGMKCCKCNLMRASYWRSK